MPMSVPSVSCRVSKCHPKVPPSDCLTRIKGKCIYYSGSFISDVDINTGDNLDKVINQLVTYIDTAASPNTNTDTSSVDVVLSGANNRNISANVNLSPDSGNSIEIRPNGVYVPTPVSTGGVYVGNLS